MTRLLKRIYQERQLMLALLCLSFMILVLVVAACQPLEGGEGDPARAVEDYLSAMVKNDTEKLAGLVCPAYEAGAKAEFDSFGAISDAVLDGVKCTAGTTGTDNAGVTCTGQINFSYNGENDLLPLAGNTYSTQKVDGEWKMCGYS
jgi:hypothetical protein